jgi:hypothetical protein
MSVSAAYVSQLTITEQLSRQEANANSKITYDKLNSAVTLNGTSSPAVTKQASLRVTLSTGAATVDMTSMTPQNEAAVNATGLKPQLYKFQAPATNSGAITIAPGGSNGHALLGASFSITLNPGQEVSGYLDASAVTVDSTHKTIGLSGTGTDVLDMQLVFG